MWWMCKRTILGTMLHFIINGKGIMQRGSFVHCRAYMWDFRFNFRIFWPDADDDYSTFTRQIFSSDDAEGSDGRNKDSFSEGL